MNDGRSIGEQARELVRQGIEKMKRKYANDPDAYVSALEELVTEYAVSRARQLGHLM